MRETWVQSLCREDPLEKKIATHSSVLTWRIPWAEEPGRLQSMGSQRVGHNWVTNTFTFIVLPHFGVILKNLDLWNNTFLSNSICQPIIYLLHVSFCFIWFSDFMVYKHIKTCLNELRFPSILSGEGNGTPRQYSCLENPMDAGAWWAAVHGWLRVGHDWATSLSLFTFTHWRRKWQPTPVFLPGESQGRGSLVGCRLWGRTESDTTEVT